MRVKVADELVRGRAETDLEQAVREGLLLRDYLNADISLGKFAELMSMSYVEGCDWLHRHGIATLRKFTDPALEATDDENYRQVATALGIINAEHDP